ncbi:MAG: NAD(+)/NADH kinase [Nanoarchaeota archaeon]
MKVLVVCKHSEDSDESKGCRLIKNTGFEIVYSWKDTLKPSDLEEVDIVISIGGDGTALLASHFLIDKPLLAVNSAPKTSEGALTTITADELDRKLGEIKKGAFQLEKLERIEVYINDKLQKPLALNEVFMANRNAYLMSRYKVRVENEGRVIEEEQRSSGLIFSTGTGSTAWFKSAGGEPFSAQERYIKMLVREPFLRRISRFKTLVTMVNERGWAEIVPLTDMVLAIDSIREFLITPKDKVKIKISNRPLLRIK